MKICLTTAPTKIALVPILILILVTAVRRLDGAKIILKKNKTETQTALISFRAVSAFLKVSNRNPVRFQTETIDDQKGFKERPADAGWRDVSPRYFPLTKKFHCFSGLSIKKLFSRKVKL